MYLYLVPTTLRDDDASAAVSLLCECLDATCLDFEPGEGWICLVPRPLTPEEQGVLEVRVWNESVRTKEPDHDLVATSECCICDALPSEATEIQRRYEHTVSTTPRRMPLGALRHVHYRRLVYRLWDVVNPWYAEALTTQRSAELHEIMSHIRPYRFARFAMDVRQHGA